jgi:hypothetical protein
VTRIRLSTKPADEIVAIWIVDYTVTQKGRESHFTVPCVAEAGARRMVANLLNDRLPGLSEADVYTEELD